MYAVIQASSGKAEEEPTPLLYRRRRQRRRPAAGRRGRRMGLSQDVLGHDVVMGADEVRADVKLTNLDQPLFDEAAATKRDLVDYLDAVSARILPGLQDRPLSVVRVLRGQAPFMQKNVPKYTPDWVRTVPVWAEASKRTISYALCNDRPTLLWFANQRAVEYHPTLFRIDEHDRPTHLVMDIDPPEGEAFPLAVRAAHLVHAALAELGLRGAVKTSGAKGVHVFVPLGSATTEEVAAATRALAARAERLDPELATTAFVREERAGKVFLDSTRAGGATVVAAYSPRLRPGVPVSFPLAWDELDGATPRDFTVHTALDRLGDADPWRELMPSPQDLPAELVAEGREIPIARVQAMHEGKRRARARRASDG
jgi:bifunctional non-homologous end joining protein LigD